MVHIVAVLLTLFPGFGLGYLLLGRIRQFAIHFLVCMFPICIFLVGLLYVLPLLLAGMVLILAPLLVWNVYHAHRLWMEDTADDLEETSGQNRSPSALGPIIFIILLALGILLATQNWSLFFPRDPKELHEILLEQVEAKLDKHHLALIGQRSGTWRGSGSRFYKVEPEDYNLTVHTDRNQYRGVLAEAERLGNSTDHFVYAQGFEVYVLETQNEDAISRFVADLAEHRPDDCMDGEDVGVCGFAP